MKYRGRKNQVLSIDRLHLQMTLKPPRMQTQSYHKPASHYNFPKKAHSLFSLIHSCHRGRHSLYNLITQSCFEPLLSSCHCHQHLKGSSSALCWTCRLCRLLHKIAPCSQKPHEMPIGSMRKASIPWSIT